MKESFIISNRARKVIFAEIASGETSLERITKKNHLVASQAESSLKELIENSFVEEKDGKLDLTEEGKRSLRFLKRERLI
jgi:GatB domain.